MLVRVNDHSQRPNDFTQFIIVGTLADKNGWKICEIMKWNHEILNFYGLKQLNSSMQNQMYT